MNNALMNQAVRENRFLRPNEITTPESWMDRLGKADTNPLISAGLALLTTGVGDNPMATAFQSFTNAAKNKQAAAELATQEANLKAASDSMLGAQDYSTYQKALQSYAALPGADKDLMATTAAVQRERLTGIPVTTGMTVDPVTGQTRYVEPVPFSNQLDQKRQLADLDYEYKLKGLDATDARDRAQEEWMAQNSYGGYYQAPSAGGSGGTMSFDPTTGTMVYDQGPTKGQQQAQASVYAARQKDADKTFTAANAAVGAGQQLVDLAGQLSSSPLWNKVAGAVEGTVGLGGDAGEAMKNMDQALTPLAIGMHPGGPMTDADFQAYRKAILDPNQSTEARVAAAKRAQAGAQGNLAYLQAQREWFDANNGSLAGFDEQVGKAIAEQWRQHRNSL